MAIALRSTASNVETSNVTQITINKPAGTLDDDILIAYVVWGEADSVISVPGGWTIIDHNETTTERDQSSVLAWKRASSEGASYTFTHAGTAARMSGGIAAFSGCQTTGSPVDQYASNTGTNNPSPVCPSITTTVDNTMVICAASITHTGPTDASCSKADNEIHDEFAQNAHSYSGCYAHASAGATGTATVVFTDGDAAAEWHSYQAALKAEGAVTIELSGTIAGTSGGSGTLGITRSLSGTTAGTSGVAGTLEVTGKVNKETLLPAADGWAGNITTNTDTLLIHENFRNNSDDYAGWSSSGDVSIQYDTTSPDKTSYVLFCPSMYSAYAALYSETWGSTMPSMHVGCWLKITAASMSNSTYKACLRFRNGGDEKGALRIRCQSDGTYVFGFRFNDYSTTWTNDTQDLTSHINSTWFWVDLSYDADGNGKLTIYKSNGAVFWDPSSIDLNGAGAAEIDQLQVGIFGYDDEAISLRFACIQVWTDAPAGLAGRFTNVFTDDSDTTWAAMLDENGYIKLAFEDTARTNPKGVRICARMKTSLNPIETRTRLGLTGEQSVYHYDCLVTESWKDYYWEFEKDPYTPAEPWTQAKINAMFGSNQAAKSVQYEGLQISKMWAEVFWGATGDAWVTHIGLMFALQDEIQLTVRVNEETDVKIRYGTNEANVKTNTGDTQDTSPVTLTSATAFTHIFTISSLSADTTYFFDVMVQQSSGSYQSTWFFEGGDSSVYWANLPRCKTLPANDATELKMCAAGDLHGRPTRPDMYSSIASHSPDLFVDLGDIQTLGENIHASGTDKDEIREKYYQRLGFNCTAVHFTENIGARIPTITFWSDHDWAGNNKHKWGDGFFYDKTETYLETYKSLEVRREIFPGNYLAPDNITGTATGGSTTTLEDTGGSFTNAHPGLVVHKTSGTVAAAIIKSISGTTVTFCEALTNSQTFAGGGATYVIACSGLWQKVECGPFVMMILDARGLRDPNGTVFGSKTDAIVWGLYQNDVSKELAGDSTYTATTQSGTDGDTIITSGMDFTANCVQWDGVKNVSCSAEVTGSLTSAPTDNGSPNYTWTLTDSSKSWATNMHQDKRVFNLSDSNPACVGRVISNTSNTLIVSYMVDGNENDWTNGDSYKIEETPRCSLVAEDGIAANQLDLEWEIPGQTSGQTIRIFESGASQHGSYAADAAAGHVQRAAIQEAYESIDAGQWPIMLTETPIYHGEFRVHDKWNDFDWNCLMTYASKWHDEGSNYYFTTGVVTKPGGVQRFFKEPYDAGQPDAMALIEVANKSDLADAGLVDGTRNGKYYWWYDQAQERVYLYGDDYLTGSGRLDVWFFHPNFADRCAMRLAVVYKYRTLNAVCIAADRHFGVLDDASNSLDPWPHVGASPLHTHPDKSHSAVGQWQVNGKCARYDRTMGRIPNRPTSWTAEGDYWYVSGYAEAPLEVFRDDTELVLAASKVVLDSTGEYWYDSTNDRVYLWDDTDDPADSSVIIQMEPPRGNGQLGCYCLAEFTDEIVTFSLRERNGEIIYNGSPSDIDYYNHELGFLGDMVMQVPFSTRLIDEEFEDVADGYDESWTVEEAA